MMTSQNRRVCRVDAVRWTVYVLVDN